ncbi:MAG TPA: DUF58 domain-containing protein, partial [Myxococcales bacterium]|nr:DUF58 domain-containing protein [Myxococcales bacterium]
MPRPTFRAVAVLALASLPAGLAFVSPVFGAVALGLDAALLLLWVLDAWLSLPASGAVVRRELPDRIPRKRPFDVVLTVFNPGRRPLRVRLADRLSAGFEPREAEAALVVPGFGSATVRREAVALVRGDRPLQPPAGERESPLGLARWPLAGEGASRLSVLPDLTPVAGFDALLRQRRLQEMGIRSARERGEGTEVASLRPYVYGDPYGGIDWKATARAARPISRERRAERRQNVVLLLDAGRRMAREADGQSRLDTAVEAALLLGHAALRADDRVGLLAFADKPLRTVAPLRSYTQAAALAQALYPLEPVLREPPYGAIAAQVMARFPRRSLLVLFTDVAEPTSIDALVGPVRFLGRRHLLLCVVFKEPAIEAALRRPPREDAELYRAGA